MNGTLSKLRTLFYSRYKFKVSFYEFFSALS
jgi:hypothetical protein